MKLSALIPSEQRGEGVVNTIKKTLMPHPHEHNKIKVNEGTMLVLPVAWFYSFMVMIVVGIFTIAGSYYKYNYALQQRPTREEWQQWADEFRQQNKSLPLNVPSLPRGEYPAETAFTETQARRQ